MRQICNDDPEFFIELFDRIESLDIPHKLIIGDINVVIDSANDRFNSTETHLRSQGIIKTYVDEGNITDIWRDLQEAKKRYSWFRYQPQPSFSRIDYFLISNSLNAYVEDSRYMPGFRSDHSFVELILQHQELDRGPGMWKLNSYSIDQSIRLR